MRYSGPPTCLPAARSARRPRRSIARARSASRRAPSSRVYSGPDRERIGCRRWTVSRAPALQKAGLRAWIEAMSESSPGARLFDRDGVIAVAAPACPDRSVANSVSYADAGGARRRARRSRGVLRRERRRRLDRLGARVRRRGDRRARGERRRPRRRPGGDEPRPLVLGSRARSATSSGTTRSLPRTSAGSTTPPTASRRRSASARCADDAVRALPTRGGRSSTASRRASSARSTSATTSASSSSPPTRGGAGSASARG